MPASPHHGSGLLRAAGIKLEDRFPQQPLAGADAGHHGFEQLGPAAPSGRAYEKHDSGAKRTGEVAAKELPDRLERKMPRARLGKETDRTQGPHDAAERHCVGPGGGGELAAGEWTFRQMVCDTELRGHEQRLRRAKAVGQSAQRRRGFDGRLVRHACGPSEGRRERSYLSALKPEAFTMAPQRSNSSR